MKQFIIYLFFAGSFYSAISQEKVEFTDPTQYIVSGYEYYQQGNVKAAIEAYSKVHENDTNYYAVLSELTAMYLIDSQYLKVIELSERIIKKDPRLEFRVHMTRALALELEERKEDAMSAYMNAIELFPKNNMAYHNTANFLVRQGRIAEAFEMYKKAYSLNPYHQANHFRLGLLCAENDMIIEAILSLSMALFLEPESENHGAVITILEALANGKYERDDEIEAERFSPAPRSFQQLERILESRIALNRKYKSQSKLEYDFIRQMNAMFEKLRYEANDESFWMKNYVPFFAGIYQEKMFAPFSYHILSGFDEPSVQRLVRRNQRHITRFLSWGYAYLEEKNENRYLVWGDRKIPVSYFYNNDLRLMAAGNIDKRKDAATGEWEFYHRNGVPSAQGVFNRNNQQEGEWVWFYSNGIPEKISIYKNGKLNGNTILFHENGQEARRIPYVNDKINGKVQDFRWFGGALNFEMEFKSGLRNGKTVFYHLNGEKRIEFHEKDNETHGSYREFHNNGKLAYEGKYENGVQTGPFKTYYRSGKIRSEGTYQNGKRQGEFISYFENGNISEKGSYREGVLVGKWLGYYEDGTLSGELQYDERGRQNGTIKSYDRDGKLHYEMEFSGGDLNGYKYFDKDGNIISQGRRTRNTLEVKGYTPEGQLKFVGNYLRGEKDGHWKTYFSNGNLFSEEHYENGKEQGISKFYYQNGNISSEISYEDGIRNGYFAEYHRNSQISLQGYYLDGKLAGEVISYYGNGQVSRITYYVNGELHGRQKYFTEEGKPRETFFYENGNFLGFKNIDREGNIYNEVRFDQGNYEKPLLHLNGNILSKRAYRNTLLEGPVSWFDGLGNMVTEVNYFAGERNGTQNWYYESGKLKSTANFIYGQREGKSIWYYENGQIETEGEYRSNSREGKWHWYHENGKLEGVANYVEGNLQGERRYYDEEGELIKIRYYKDDYITAIAYHNKNDKIEKVIKLPNGSGEFTTYFANGNKSSSGSFRFGYLEGPMKYYHSNGRLASEIHFENGRRHGKAVTYYANGNLKSEENYVHGQQDGVSKHYHSNGKIESEMNYIYGDLFGTSKFYDRNGKLIKTREYYRDHIVAEVKN